MILNLSLKCVFNEGAQWIHGNTNNPIYDYCKEKDLVNEDLKSISNKFFVNNIIN